MNLLKRKKELDELYSILKDISSVGLIPNHWERVKKWMKKYLEFKNNN